MFSDHSCIFYTHAQRVDNLLCSMIIEHFINTHFEYENMVQGKESLRGDTDQLMLLFIHTNNQRVTYL